jgi:hypothetical protein
VHRLLPAWPRFASTLLLSCPVVVWAQYPLRPSPVLERGAIPTSLVVQGQLSVRHTQVGDSATDIIRNARLGILARPRSTIVVKLQADLAAVGRVGADSGVTGFALTDAYVQLTPTDTARWRRLHPAIVIGQFKSPFSLEYLTSVGRLLAPNRSVVVDRLAPRRDIGAMGQLDMGHVVVMGGFSNGEGQNVKVNPDGTDLFTTRVTVLPRRNLGIAAKVAAQGGDHLWGYDARWMPGHAVLEGEYIQRTRAAGSLPAADAEGGYLLAAYRVRKWVQPVVKWEQFDQDAPTVQRSRWLTAGAVGTTESENLRVLLNMIRKRDDPGQHVTELVGQLVIYF